MWSEKPPGFSQKESVGDLCLCSFTWGRISASAGRNEWVRSGVRNHKKKKFFKKLGRGEEGQSILPVQELGRQGSILLLCFFFFEKRHSF